MRTATSDASTLLHEQRRLIDGFDDLIADDERLAAGDSAEAAPADASLDSRRAGLIGRLEGVREELSRLLAAGPLSREDDRDLAANRARLAALAARTGRLVERWRARREGALAALAELRTDRRAAESYRGDRLRANMFDITR